jgi:hypothetical protein
MGGLAVLLFFVGYVVWGIFIVLIGWRYRSWLGGALAALIVIALPFTDALIGRAILKGMCAKSGNVSSPDKVVEIKCLGVQYGVYKDSPAYYGFRCIEGGHTDKSSLMYERAEVGEDGTTVEIRKNVQPTARYVLHRTASLEGPYAPFYFFRERTTIREIETGRELAGYDWFLFRGGWAERLLMSFSDAGPSPVAQCGSLEDEKALTMKLLRSALRQAPNTAFENGRSPAAPAVQRER